MRVKQIGAISERHWLVLILVLGFLIRIAAIVAYPHQLESDELAYFAMAENLVDHHRMVDNMGNSAMYNAGYPLLVLFPLFLVFGKNLLLVKITNTALGVLSILLSYAVAKEAGAARTGRLLAAALLSLYLPASLYVVYLAKENLLTPAMLAVIWCALRFRTVQSGRIALLCGVLFATIALTGNAGLVLAVPVIFAVIYRPCSPKGRLRLLLIIGVSALLLVSPILVRNQMVLGGAVLNTNAGFNLYLGNNPVADGKFVSISDTPIAPRWEKLRRDGELLASTTLKQEALEWIKSNPATFTGLAVKKLGLFWAVPWHRGKGEVSRAEQLVRVLWACEYIVLAGLMLTLLLPRPVVTDRSAVLWLALISYSGVHMLFYVILRYREPIMPLMCVLAAIAAERMVRAVSSVPEQQRSGAT